MKIMVLGGSGFVGSHLARRLSRDGHEISIATRYAPGSRRLEVVPNVRIRQFDPYDRDTLVAELDGHDAAINLVGILNERGFSGAGFRRAHVELVETLIDACEAAGVGRLVQMSALNAGRGDSHYLKTRGEGEALVQAAQKAGRLDTTVVRPSTIFGPDDSFINRFATLLKLSPVLPLARPKARFAPVDVDDVVEAFARILERDDSIGRTYELCGAEVWALGDLVRWLRDELGLHRIVVDLPNPLGRMQGWVFDLVPGKPFSSDNYKSLKLDSVCKSNGFAELGIQPWGLAERSGKLLEGGGKQARYQQFRRRARRDRT